MYTGVLKERQRDGGSCEVQTQCIAVGDGIDYEKYEQNPVLDEKDLPKGGSRFDFRDPKMWKAQDNTYRCVVGNRHDDGSGQTATVSELCGNVRIFFSWTGNGCCL